MKKENSYKRIMRAMKDNETEVLEHIKQHGSIDFSRCSEGWMNAIKRLEIKKSVIYSQASQGYVLAKNPAAVLLGSMRSEKKAKAARENGKKGGRPKKVAARRKLQFAAQGGHAGFTQRLCAGRSGSLHHRSSVG